MAKQDRNLTRQLEKAGWTMKSGKGHEKWYCPCGEHGPIVKASTIGKGRGAQNFRAMMKRQGDCSVDIKLG